MREPLRRPPYREQFGDRWKDNIRAYFDAFGEPHCVFGKDILIICDNFVLSKRQVKQGMNAMEFGVSDSAVHFYAICSDLPDRRPARERIDVDDRYYILEEWIEDAGVAEILASVSVR